MSKWKPKLGETYYSVTQYLNVEELIWEDYNCERYLLEVGNYFKTRQEAEAAV